MFSLLSSKSTTFITCAHMIYSPFIHFLLVERELKHTGYLWNRALCSTFPSWVRGLRPKQTSCHHHGIALLLLWFLYLQDVVQPGLPYLACSSECQSDDADGNTRVHSAVSLLISLHSIYLHRRHCKHFLIHRVCICGHSHFISIDKYKKSSKQKCMVCYLYLTWTLLSVRNPLITPDTVAVRLNTVMSQWD